MSEKKAKKQQQTQKPDLYKANFPPLETRHLSLFSDNRRESSPMDPTSYRKKEKEVERLISKGKYREAVALAKELNKRMESAESAALVGRAYIARVKGMFEQGLKVEARELMKLVSAQYPSTRGELEELRIIYDVRDGMIDELIQSLLDPQITPEKREAIERVIKSHVLHPEVIAHCQVLPADHPLKTGATAILKAFSAVTNGPVADEDISLPQISRRNPFSPWKILIKAIGCFYRHEDEACRQFLEAIDPESAPYRLVPVLKAMTSGLTAEENLLPAAKSLADQITHHLGNFTKSLDELDKAFKTGNLHKIVKSIKYAVTLCRQAKPALLEILTQHISIQIILKDISFQPVKDPLGGLPRKNAYLWHLLARGMEEKGEVLLACSFWEEFQKNAVNEGRFADDSLEISAVYLHMADRLKRLPGLNAKQMRRELKADLEQLFSSYPDIFGSIGDEVLKKARKKEGPYYISLPLLYERICQINPDPENFRRWLDWSRSDNNNWKDYENVALRWRETHPKDSRPLLFLMVSAEQRSAYSIALGYLEEAEGIDGLNPQVRRARLRLLIASAMNHLKQRKPRLAEKDLAALEVLPQVKEGDRPAFLLALHWICSTLLREPTGASQWEAELIRLLGSKVAASMVQSELGSSCGLSRKALPLLTANMADLEGPRLAAAVSRCCALAQDMGFAFSIPGPCETSLKKYFTQKNIAVETPQLILIAEAALRGGHQELAYAVSGVGLVQGEAPAKFLFLRAQSLPTWITNRTRRCLSAAVKLARQRREKALLEEAIDYCHKQRNSLSINGVLSGNPLDFLDISMAANQMEEVIQREKEAIAFPRSVREDFFDGQYRNPVDDCDCYNCRRRRGELGQEEKEGDFEPDDDDVFEEDKNEEEADSYWDDKDDEIDLTSFGFPPNLPPRLRNIIIELLRRHASPDGALPDLKELERIDPEFMKRADQALFDYYKAGGNFSAFSGGPSSRKRERLRKLRKKRRKRR